MLSVVIPTLNESHGLVEQLRWLNACAGVSEIVVVDAGQPGLDLPRDADLSKVYLLQAQQVGRAAQMNQGAARASQPTLLFLHADSRPPQGFANLINAALENRDWGRFDIRLDHGAWRFRVIETMINLRSRFTRLATGDQGMFFRRAIFQTRGGFADLPLMEDIELSKRLGRDSPPALITTPLTTSARRWLQHGTWRTILLMWKLRYLYWRGTDPAILATMYQDAR